LFLLHVISELHVLLSLPFFSSFSSASVQFPSNSLRFSWTGNMQEDDDAAGFIEGFPSKHSQ
jgi:hypothetical protein